jgi:hypothetical protein
MLSRCMISAIPNERLISALPREYKAAVWVNGSFPTSWIWNTVMIALPHKSYRASSTCKVTHESSKAYTTLSVFHSFTAKPSHESLKLSQGPRDIWRYPILRERQDSARRGVLHTLCPYHLARIDGPLKLMLVPRHSRALESTQDARELQQGEPQLSMQIKLAGVHTCQNKTEYMRAPETCGAIERHTCRRTQDAGLGRQRCLFYDPGSV